MVAMKMTQPKKGGGGEKEEEEKELLIIRKSCFHGEGSEVHENAYCPPSQKAEMFTMESAFLWVAIISDR